MMAGAGASPYELASDAASRLGIAVGAEELATLASDLDLGDGEMAAVAATFSYLAEKRRLASIETLLRLSRLPRREPKTFEGFDFSRIQGRDAAALGKLPSLADLYAHRNVAFVGPGGIGKTHLAQAYGRECCMRGLKTYYIKATELRDRFQKAVQRETPRGSSPRSSSRRASSLTRWGDASTTGRAPTCSSMSSTGATRRRGRTRWSSRATSPRAGGMSSSRATTRSSAPSAGCSTRRRCS